jgi:HSP20 family protein
MSDMDNNKKVTFLVAMMAVLMIAVIAQGVALFGLHRKMGHVAERSHQREAVGMQSRLNSTNPFAILPQLSDRDADVLNWNLADWDPFKEMHAMQDRINQMFGSAVNRFRTSDDFGRLFGNYSFSPDINLEDKGDHYLITVDLPGSEDSQIAAKIEGQVLIISGSIKADSKQEEKGHFLRQERRSGKFERMLSLPSPVSADKMTTTVNKGVLRITVPKVAK